MERKIEAKFVDEGFGFPVTLLNVHMVKVRGTWTPELNYKMLAETVLIALAQKPARLTGAEIKFIRTHFEMTLKDFAERLGVSHPAVLKWEAAKKKSTTMNWSTEKDIRLFAVSRLRKGQMMLAVYKQLETPVPSKTSPIAVDAENFAA